MANTSFTSVSFWEPSRFRINTQHFSPHDLSLFVDCMETITRLTRAKRERKECKKLHNLPAKVEPESGKVMLLENENRPKTANSETSDSDETYFSAPSSSQSSPRHNGVVHQKQLSDHSSKSINSLMSSDSEESGVYAMDSTQHIVCGTPAAKPSFVLATQKHTSSSKKSRFFGMMRRKASSKANSVKLVASRALDEYETLDIYQQQMMQSDVPEKCLKPNRFANLHLRKLSRQEYAVCTGRSQECFFDKALRYLTL